MRVEIWTRGLEPDIGPKKVFDGHMDAIPAERDCITVQGESHYVHRRSWVTDPEPYVKILLLCRQLEADILEDDQ